MANDTYASSQPGLIGQALGGEAVVPSDTVDQSFVCRALYVGVSGNVVLRMLDGSVLTFVGLPVGLHPIRAHRVNATGTTATSMLFIR